MQLKEKRSSYSSQNRSRNLQITQAAAKGEIYDLQEKCCKISASFDRLITKWSAAIDRNKQKADESSNYSIIWRNLCENDNLLKKSAPQRSKRLPTDQCDAVLAALAQLHDTTQPPLAAIARHHKHYKMRRLQQILRGVKLYNKAGYYTKEVPGHRRLANGCGGRTEALQYQHFGAR
ncbi:hypothetical protein COCC4DRAFT_65583 [Bipolaris maydis ATCC 48331]|uniref:Uncharacterized protein n=2 Tax=Cochliobolus heterostrophus TaxID=5016 RepID=M2UGS9_COCH5|nr:uncharacterized protein COCC4DRAFT_65583 [Bipolaris maydis ATCC 48331]EMD87177.1 hypothetical protein COCHEDRAFT_1033641 [Bipolaris maydis C5]ENI00428.1 hypothetical protein COCC4DRAFT_65583 [Bipolaris maydis ATCC 48331]